MLLSRNAAVAAWHDRWNDAGLGLEAFRGEGGRCGAACEGCFDLRCMVLAEPNGVPAVAVGICVEARWIGRDGLGVDHAWVDENGRLNGGAVLD